MCIRDRFLTCQGSAHEKGICDIHYQRPSNICHIVGILLVRDFKYEEGVFHKERLLKFK